MNLKKPGQMNPIRVANAMAHAAVSKVQGMQKQKDGKSYDNHEEGDDAENSAKAPKDQSISGKDGAASPSAKKRAPAATHPVKPDGEMFNEMKDGAKSASEKSPNKSRSQIQSKGKAPKKDSDGDYDND